MSTIYIVRSRIPSCAIIHVSTARTGSAPVSVSVLTISPAASGGARSHGGDITLGDSALGG